MHFSRIAFTLVFLSFATYAAAVAPASATPLITVCFTPGGDCTGLVVKSIAGASHQIRVQAYSFTSAPIAKALADAHRRGIDVQVILDKSQATAKYTDATYLQHAGVPVMIDNMPVPRKKRAGRNSAAAARIKSAVYDRAALARNKAAAYNKVAIAHNKVIVIDGQTVIAGSFNFTTAAQEKNAENLLVIQDPDLAAKYLANWQSRRAVSEPYRRLKRGAGQYSEAE